MRKLMVIALFATMGLVFSACENSLFEIKTSLAGTTWKSADGDVFVFYEETVDFSGAYYYNDYMGTYEYAYPNLIIFPDLYDSEKITGKFSRKKLIMNFGHMDDTTTFQLVK